MKTKRQKTNELISIVDGETTADGKPVIHLTNKNKEFTFPEAHTNLRLWPAECLESCTSRQRCPKCDKSQAFYCSYCFLPLTPTPPKLQLPINVHIWKHYTEKQSKITGVHACLLAENAYLHMHEALPPLDPSTTMVMLL
mmetsp:Transcript_12971/g.21994  ORF Transcript_12971/g.21994 Transcript_12971/m.21994 type:complete len:140 (-) Transcript_12971:7-426(-)